MCSRLLTAADGGRSMKGYLSCRANRRLENRRLEIRGSQMPKVAINGLGRIGRAALKILLESEDLELVAVNDVASIENLAYLLRYDTVYGRYHRQIVVEADALVIDGHQIGRAHV